MAEYIRTDESRQILIFIAVPLLLLFIGGIVLWVRPSPNFRLFLCA